jgi:hypothetical protein
MADGTLLSAGYVQLGNASTAYDVLAHELHLGRGATVRGAQGTSPPALAESRTR